LPSYLRKQGKPVLKIAFLKKSGPPLFHLGEGWEEIKGKRKQQTWNAAFPISHFIFAFSIASFAKSQTMRYRPIPFAIAPKKNRIARS